MEIRRLLEALGFALWGVYLDREFRGFIASPGGRIHPICLPVTLVTGTRGKGAEDSADGRMRLATFENRGCRAAREHRGLGDAS